MTRRDLLAFAATSPSLALAQSASTQNRPRLRTALCARLGIEHPILQAPMAGVVTAELAAAVSEAGGLGILPGVGRSPEEICAQIRAVRARTSRPFGVNLLLHPAIRQPARPADIPQALVAQVRAVLDELRVKVGLAPSATAEVPTVPARVDAALEMLLDERVPVFSIGLGKPEPTLVRRFQQNGTVVIAMAATVPDALELAASGVDAIVAQGSEAGGHRSTWIKRERPEQAGIGTLALVPQVVQAVKVPVIAAGGIMDGRGVLAALALGASGALLGTRFVATAESAAPPFYKQALLDAESDATTLTDAFTGLWARVLRSKFTDGYRERGAAVLPPIVQQAAVADITTAAAARGDRDFYPLYAGQGVGLVDDLPSAGEVVRSAAVQAAQILEELASGARS